MNMEVFYFPYKYPLDWEISNFFFLSTRLIFKSMLSKFFWNSFLRWVSKFFLIFAMTKFLLNAKFLMF